ncbi:MAG: hypothetical protein M3303_01075, partial [Gemmatimonadota bacterium]|nr:hypothetical protein [Gemmatimonadota bacterium]
RRAVAVVEGDVARVARGVAEIRIACAGPPRERCRGRLALTVPGRARGGRRRPSRPVVVGSARFALRTAASTRLRLALSPGTRRRLAARRRVEVQWRTVSIDRAGNKTFLVLPLSLVARR